jgi:hypothetical protein
MFGTDQYTAVKQAETDATDEDELPEQPDRYTGSEATEGVNEALAAFLDSE